MWNGVIMKANIQLVCAHCQAVNRLPDGCLLMNMKDFQLEDERSWLGCLFLTDVISPEKIYNAPHSYKVLSTKG